jgi:predicted Zn-dependent protease
MIENLVRTRSGLGQLTKHAVVNLLQKGYSRENELAADRYGIQLMASAGFKSKAAITALNKLRTIKSDSNEVFNFFSTHPPLPERIAQINEQINKNPN